VFFTFIDSIIYSNFYLVCEAKFGSKHENSTISDFLRDTRRASRFSGTKVRNSKLTENPSVNDA
jgi:hypothetical protein